MNAAQNILRNLNLPNVIDPKSVKKTLADMQSAASQLDNSDADKNPAKDVVDIRLRHEDGTGKKLVLDRSQPDSVSLKMVQKWADGARMADVKVADGRTSVKQQDFAMIDGKPFPTNHSFISFDS